MRNYTTAQGDTWDIISYRVYGTEKVIDILIEANHQYRNVTIFPANIKLVIPDVETVALSTLPPWKRS
ncbi:hypothetical protein SCACP_21310 [Sporomusa carbonis]|uniref:tail protein X n=1 Tax=Sporomusa carbonis TaxID=3076075 RepID=UPI003A65FF68